MDIKGHAAIVTGGGSGLGAATAAMLAAAGAKVALLDVNLDAANAHAKTIGGIAVKCDVSDAASAEAAVKEANAKLGYASDLRDYGLGAQILFDLGVRQFRFLTNNPKKVVGLEGYGLEMIEQVPIRAEANPHNIKYLETKKTKLGHML